MKVVSCVTSSFHYYVVAVVQLMMLFSLSDCVSSTYRCSFPPRSNKPSWLQHETKVQQIANIIKVFEFQLLLDNINVGFYV